MIRLLDTDFNRLNLDMKIRITSKLNKILDLLKLLLTLFNLKVHSNLSLTYSFKQTKIFFIMAKIFIIFNPELSKNSFMLFTFNLFIFFILVSNIKSFCQKKSLSGRVCDYFNIHKNLSHSHIQNWKCWNRLNFI